MEGTTLAGLVFDFLNDTTAMSAITGDDNATFADENMTTTSVLSTTSTTTTTTLKTTTQKPCYPWSVPRCDPVLIVTYYVTMYGNTFAYIIGIPGSVLTMIILTRMRPFNSSSLWLFVLSFFDLFNLLLRLTVNQISVNGQLRWKDWSCRLFYMSAEFTQNSTFYFLVGLTVERLIAVWFPLKMSIFCTVKKAAVAIFFITAVCLACTTHNLETRRVNGVGACIVRNKYIAFWTDIYGSIIMNTVMYLVPVASLCVLNILIFYRLRQSRKVQKQMTDQKNREKDKQQKQIFRMLLAATIWMVICTTPHMVYRYIDRSLGPYMPREANLDRIRQVLSNGTGLLRMYNHAANFLLYVIAARRFRSELIRLVTFNKFIGINKRAPTTSSSKKYITDTKGSSGGTSGSKRATATTN